MFFRFQKQTHRSSLIPCISTVLPFILYSPNPVFQLLLIYLYSLGVCYVLSSGLSHMVFFLLRTNFPPFLFFLPFPPPSLLPPFCSWSSCNEILEIMGNFYFYILSLSAVCDTTYALVNYSINVVPYI